MACVLFVFEVCLAMALHFLQLKAQAGQTVKFTGFIVAEDRTKPDPAKIEALCNFPAPRTSQTSRATSDWLINLANLSQTWNNFWGH